MTQTQNKPFAAPNRPAQMVFSILLSVLVVQPHYKLVEENQMGVVSPNGNEQFSSMRNAISTINLGLKQSSFASIPRLTSGITSEWLTTAISKVEEMQNLKTGWDGYSAEAPTPETIVRTRAILHTLYREKMEPNRVAPSAEGGVTLAFFAGDQYGDVEILNLGETLAVVSSGNGNPQVWEVTNDVDILETLGRIRDYIWHG